MSLFVPFLATVAIALAGTAAAQEARVLNSSCDSIVAKIEAMRNAGDVDGLSHFLVRARDIKTGCAETTLLCLGRSVAVAYVQKAYALADAGKSSGEIEAISPVSLENSVS